MTNYTARSDSEREGGGLPEALPGHWDTAEGRQMAERYLAQSRRDLCKGELSDLALANAQYLEDISVGTVTFQSAIGMQTAAKERIRWLSAHLAATTAALNGVLDASGARGSYHALAYADAVADAENVIAKARGEA